MARKWRKTLRSSNWVEASRNESSQLSLSSDLSLHFILVGDCCLPDRKSLLPDEIVSLTVAVGVASQMRRGGPVPRPLELACGLEASHLTSW